MACVPSCRICEITEGFIPRPPAPALHVIDYRRDVERPKAVADRRLLLPRIRRSQQAGSARRSLRRTKADRFDWSGAIPCGFKKRGVAHQLFELIGRRQPPPE